jgi:hypothetical protein
MTRVDGTPGVPHPAGLTVLLRSGPVYRQNHLTYRPLASVQADRGGDHRRRRADPPDGTPQTVRPRGVPPSWSGVVYAITEAPQGREGAPARLTHLRPRAIRNVS